MFHKVNAKKYTQVVLITHLIMVILFFASVFVGKAWLLLGVFIIWMGFIVVDDLFIHVKCPHCGVTQYLKHLIKALRINKEHLPYRCDHCGGRIYLEEIKINDPKVKLQKRPFRTWQNMLGIAFILIYIFFTQLSPQARLDHVNDELMIASVNVERMAVYNENQELVTLLPFGHHFPIKLVANDTIEVLPKANKGFRIVCQNDKKTYFDRPAIKLGEGRWAVRYFWRYYQVPVDEKG